MFKHLRLLYIFRTGSLSTPGGNPQQQQPPQQVGQTNIQRVIVKNSDGKPVQISASALQKLLSSANSGTSTGNIVVSSPAPAAASASGTVRQVFDPHSQPVGVRRISTTREERVQIQDGAQSIVQVIQRPATVIREEVVGAGAKPQLLKVNMNT